MAQISEKINRYFIIDKKPEMHFFEHRLYLATDTCDGGEIIEKYPSAIQPRDT